MNGSNGLVNELMQLVHRELRFPTLPQFVVALPMQRVQYFNHTCFLNHPLMKLFSVNLVKSCGSICEVYLLIQPTWRTRHVLQIQLLYQATQSDEEAYALTVLRFQAHVIFHAVVPQF